MPVTPAHAAAALPLARLGLPTLALVVGTQVPDLPMVYPAITLSYRITHDYLLGLPVDVAYGYVLWRLCVWILPAAIALLSEPLRRKLSAWEPPALSWRTLVALALGSLSHLVWDEFTHQGRFGERHLPLLRAAWAFGIPGYRWLQYGTGALALAGMALWALIKVRALPERDDVPRRWPALERRGVGVALLVLLPVASLARAGLETNSAHDFAFVAITTLMASELIALTAARAWFSRRSSER